MNAWSTLYYVVNVVSFEYRSHARTVVECDKSDNSLRNIVDL